MFDRSARYAAIVLCICLVVCGVGFRVAIKQYNVTLQKDAVPLRKNLRTIPTRLDEWTKSGNDEVFSAEIIEALDTEDYLSRTYVRRAPDGRGDWVVSVHLAYYTGMIDAIPHVPDRCFEAGGLQQRTQPAEYDLPLDQSRWPPHVDKVNERTGEPYPTALISDTTRLQEWVLMPVAPDGYRIRVTEFSSHQQTDARIYGGYFFVSNGRTTAQPWQIKKLAFDRSERAAYYCKVQFTVQGGPEFSMDDYTTLVADLLDPLLPEIMACLPDWSEVEGRASAAAPATDA